MMIIEIKQNQGSLWNTHQTIHQAHGLQTLIFFSQLQLSSSKVLVKRKGDTITIVVSGQYILIPTLTVIALRGRHIPMIHPLGRQLSDSLHQGSPPLYIAREYDTVLRR